MTGVRTCALAPRLGCPLWAPSGVSSVGPIWGVLCGPRLGCPLWAPSGVSSVGLVCGVLCGARLVCPLWAPSGVSSVGPAWCVLCGPPTEDKNLLGDVYPSNYAGVLTWSRNLT